MKRKKIRRKHQGGPGELPLQMQLRGKKSSLRRRGAVKGATSGGKYALGDKGGKKGLKRSLKERKRNEREGGGKKLGKAKEKILCRANLQG